ncbi:MAG: GntR family transcriptional regulator [Pigmentiphaga sp.]
MTTRQSAGLAPKGEAERGKPNTGPKAPPTTTDRIRAQLESEIGSGVWLPGQPLDEQALSERFQVSRTPVREALLQLSVLGFVEVVPRAGIFVRELQQTEAAAMFEALACLEGLCAGLSAKRLSAAQRRELIRLHRRAERQAGATGAAYEHANQEFHNLIHASAGNDYLVGQIQHIRRRTYAYRLLRFGENARARQSHAEHQTILDALVNADAQAASLAAIEHIAQGRQDFSDFVNRCAEGLFASQRRARSKRKPGPAGLMTDAQAWIFPARPRS